MSVGVLGLVLAASFAHAGWNFLAKGAEGGAGFVWLCAALGTLIWVPALAVALAVHPGELDWAAIGLMAGSGALHALYFTLLQRGYAEGDLSLVYPLARGTGPLLSGAAAIVFLGERPSALALAGALIIVGAVFSLAGRHGTREAVGFALLTGVAIASYTLWDKHAVGPSELSPVVYYWGSNLIVVLILTPIVLRRGVQWGLRRAAGVGLLSPLAYVLVLFALARAPVSIVAPARETSILIGKRPAPAADAVRGRDRGGRYGARAGVSGRTSKAAGEGWVSAGSRHECHLNRGMRGRDDIRAAGAVEPTPSATQLQKPWEPLHPARRSARRTA